MTAYDMFHVFMCGRDERIANVYRCYLCLASSCDLPIMLCTTDGLYTVFSIYPHLWLWDALATSSITAATLANIKRGTPFKKLVKGHSPPPHSQVN